MTSYNLPPQPTPFIGRERELSEISALLNKADCRLLTLVGAGGIGKTRLAIEAARQISLSNGVHFIALQPLTSSDFIIPAIAEALDVQFYSSSELKRQLLDYLSEKSLLLVLDNFEHLLDGVGLLSDIVSAAPRIKLFVTSRERLSLVEEWVLDVAGLSFPFGETAAAIENFSAVQLFVQRAQQTQTNFSLKANEDAVKRICQQVEGMPLALELAASWLRAMSCEQIVAHMADSIDFLSTPLRNVPERQRSMRLVFEQSWRLLSTAEQDVLMRLSVFRGGFDGEAAEQVAGASLPLLAGLADKSLIRLNSVGRYDLHELLRQYAADKLLEANEVNATIQHHLDYFLKLAEQAEAHTFGREQGSWFDRLEIELDNLRAALAWSAESKTGLRLAGTMKWFFSEYDHVTEGLDWLERMLAANQDATASVRSKALHSAAALAGILGNAQKSRAHSERALILARGVNDRWNAAWSLSYMALYIDDPSRSAALLDESLALFRELDDAMGIAHTLIRRMWFALNLEDYAYVSLLHEEAVIRAQESGDKIITAWIAYNFAMVSQKRDQDLNQARANFVKALYLFREARLQIGCNMTLMILADIEQKTGNPNNARKYLEENLFSLRETTPNTHYLPFVLAQLANIAREHNQLKRATTLLGAAMSIALVEKHAAAEDAYLESEMAALHTQLGETDFSEALAVGKAMTRDQIIAYALESKTPAVEEPDKLDLTQAASTPLTKREVEILYLIAEGLSNRKIAERLFISAGTVKWYLSEIYSKLGVGSRIQAVSRARALRLLN